LDAAGHSRIGCSSEPGEDDAERLTDDQEQASREPVSIMFQNSNPKGLPRVATARGSERAMRDGLLVSNLGMRDGGIRHPSKNRTHVP
jgi:hypothetical protein